MESAAAPSPQLAEHRSAITRIEDYLSAITTIVADFTQVAPDGTLASGKFFLQRPGKMRWQYNPPTPILMVSSGSVLTFYDYELEQISEIPLDSTLIGFLARNPIRFDSTVSVKEISEDAGAIRVTVTQTGKPGEGELTLEFSNRPLLLRNIVVKDAGGQITSVALNNARFGEKIDSGLFVFKDPRKGRRRT